MTGTKSFDGQLQIDYNSGVIYFHCSHPDTPFTLLRICGLKRLSALNDGDQIDITVTNPVSSLQEPGVILAEARVSGTSTTPFIPKGQLGQ